MKASRLPSFMLTALVCLAIAPAFHAAPSSALTLAQPIDLSPGVDVTQSETFVVNRSNHKLYVSGPQHISGHTLKIIDTVTKTPIGGLRLSLNPGPGLVRDFVMAVDESPGPDGNKLYALLRLSNSYFVRVIDSATDTELTGPGSDIALPITPQGDQPVISQMVVNPTTHKLYVMLYDGRIVVVDGPARRVITTLNPNAGNFLAVDPVQNKIFVFGANGGAIVDGATESVSAPPEPFLFKGTAASFNQVDKLLYLTARVPGPVDSYGVFVVDGASGKLVRSKQMPELYGVGYSIALFPDENVLYVGAYDKVYAFATTDLSLRGEIAIPGGPMASDPTGSAALISGGNGEANAIRFIERASAEVRYVRTAYRPHKVAVNSRTNRIYVLDAEANEFVVLNGKDKSVIARVAIAPARQAPSTVRDIVVSERLNRVYVSYRQYVPPRPPQPTPAELQVVDVYDGQTNELRSSFQVNNVTGVLAIDDTRRRIYFPAARQHVFSEFTWHLDVYDTDTEAFVSSIDTGKSGRISPGSGALAVNPTTGKVYISTANKRVSVVDGNTLTLLPPVALQAEATPKSIAINRKSNKVYVENRSHVSVIDGVTDTQIGSFAVGGDHGTGSVGLTGVAVDEEADTVNVTDTSYSGDGEVHRLLSYEGQNNHALVGELDIRTAHVDLTFNPLTREFLASDRANGLVTVVQTGGTAPRNQFGNLSTRLRVGGSDDVMISGVIVNAPPGATKKVMIRAVGPSLVPLGVKGALTDTILELHTAAGQVITNDNWKINAATLASQQAEIEATGLASGDDREAAILAELPAGAHTAVIRGKDGLAGVGLAEVFIIENDSTAQLANIATRGRVGTGEDVMIGGVIVKGTSASRVLVRAIGPSLQGQLQGALQDPVLELRDIHGGLIAINDDWRSNQEAEIAATTIPPTHDQESAILADLFPGNYTAIVSGAAESTGVAVVEAYDVR